jgi:hypothetical protein
MNSEKVFCVYFKVENDNMTQKIIIVSGVVLLCFVTAVFFLLIGRNNAILSGKKGQIFFLQNYLTLIIPDESRVLMSPISIDSNTGLPISWREQFTRYMVEHSGIIDPNSPDFFHYQYDQKNYTSYVAVVGERTLWTEGIRNKILQKNFPFDKILLLEISEKNIPWNSCIDYDVETTIKLWEQTRKSFNWFGKNKLIYITYKGNIGFISDFGTKEELQQMLIFSDEEILQLGNYIPPGNSAP